METYNTTITDKPNYKIEVLDTKKFQTLSVDEKIIFEIIRNSMLEIMPKKDTDNFHDNECIRFAENFAFINLNIFSKGIEKILDKKLSELEQKINQNISSLINK